MTMEKQDHMMYLPEMEVLEDSRIQERVIEKMEQYDYRKYTGVDVKKALTKATIGEEDFKAFLSPAAEPYLEEMAQKARRTTRSHFGNSINMFTPIYIANYCDNHCVYCGFNRTNHIKRAKLDDAGIEKEMESIAETGLQEILILTGESRKMSDVKYIGNAVKIARKYFTVIGLEIYPVNTEEYQYLHQCGADYVTVFQETYDSDRYGKLHLAGNKRIFPYRFNAQERALRGGMRGVGFAALLGLSDFHKDAFATGMHAYLLQQQYPWAEIAISCPRLRPTIVDETINPKDVTERKLLQILCAYRFFLPFAAITVSTRENANFRNHVMGIIGSKISAESKVGIGGHSGEEEGDEQFEISDSRSVDQVHRALLDAGLQPVMSEYIYV